MRGHKHAIGRGAASAHAGTSNPGTLQAHRVGIIRCHPQGILHGDHAQQLDSLTQASDRHIVAPVFGRHLKQGRAG